MYNVGKDKGATSASQDEEFNSIHFVFEKMEFLDVIIIFFFILGRLVYKVNMKYLLVPASV